MGGREFIDELVIGTAAQLSPFVRTYWVNGAMPQPSGFSADGSQSAPFLTIQEALDAAGPAVDFNDQIVPYTILIAGGFYDENLVVPETRSVNFVALETVLLGDGVPASVPRTVTIPNTVLPFVAVAQSVTFSSVGDVVTSFFVSGGIIASSTVNGDIVVLLRRCSVQGPTNPSVDARTFTGGGQLQLKAYDTLFFSTDAGATGIPCIEGAVGGDSFRIRELVRCRLESKSVGPVAVSVFAGKYDRVFDTQFDGDLVFTAVGNIIDNSSGMPGFYQCGFGGASSDFSGAAAGDFLLDGVSNYQFKGAGGALLGGTSKTIQDDLVP